MSPEEAQPTELPARSSITTTAEKVVVTFGFPRDLAASLTPRRSSAGGR